MGFSIHKCSRCGNSDVGFWCFFESGSTCCRSNFSSCGHERSDFSGSTFYGIKKDISENIWSKQCCITESLLFDEDVECMVNNITQKTEQDVFIYDHELPVQFDFPPVLVSAAFEKTHPPDNFAKVPLIYQVCQLRL
jgi:hypothetical protein